MQSSQSMYNLGSFNSPHYVPSHLRQAQTPSARSKTSHTHHSSQGQQQSPPFLRRSSSTTSKFGGPGFGTPKQARHKSGDYAVEDAPPTESIYDLAGGSPFSRPASAHAHGGLPATPLHASQYQQRSGFNTSTAGHHPLRTSTSLYTLPQSTPQQATLASLPTAVVIFGFPSNLTGQVLTHFARFGDVAEHASSSQQQAHSMGTNWAKITYQHPAAAQRAVAANGTLILDQVMVGCVYAQEDAPQSREVHQQGQDSDASYTGATGAQQSPRQGDAMEIDPMTPPAARRSGGGGGSGPQMAFAPNHGYSTPNQSAATDFYSTTPAQNNNNTKGSLYGQANGQQASGTPGGRRIEVLHTDGIYKSSSPLAGQSGWMPGWMPGLGGSPAAQRGNGSSPTTGKQEDRLSGTAVTTDSGIARDAPPSTSWSGRLGRGLADIVFGF